jgi:hypothetical protein
VKRDDEKLIPDLEKEWPAEEPPAGFADRVMAAQERPKRRFPWAIVAGVAAIAAMVLVSTISRGVVGTHEGSARAELSIGKRGIAVAEAGAKLSWSVTRQGDAEVKQSAGDVFYRVERGGLFAVKTPAGEVHVRGTCFRVEVSEMKKGLLQMGAGAAMATAVLVTVYEGKVLLANEHGKTALAAGEKARAESGRAPEAVSPGATASVTPIEAPPADATREDLITRERAQRAEVERLRKRVAELEVAPSAGAGQKERSKDFLNTTKEELQEMAKDCKLKWDAPPVGTNPQTMGDKQAREMGFSSQERAEFDRVSAEFNQKAWADLRGYYLEVTGDKSGAETLNPHALMEEVFAKSNERDVKEAYQRIAQERAGMAQPPKSTQGMTPVERMQRMLSAMGDNFERELGRAIGPDRAHDLRAQHGGWGSRSVSSYGCPE